MGEYMRRKPDGERIKVGTCEDLYYLRFDQLGEVQTDGDADPRSHLDAYRFRFPFPDEDDVAPGEFEDYGRGVPLYVDGLPEFGHGIVQFVAREGYNVCLPCPEGPDATSAFHVHRNGFPGNVRIVQQAVRTGGLVTIGQCGGCGHPFQFPDLDSLLPVLTALESKDSEFHREVARRAAEGYGYSLIRELIS